VVANLQAVSMLGLAFGQGRGDLLRIAMKDRIHQPYREEMCPLLPKLLPLAGTDGILGVALSGAGPAVLVIAGDEQGIGIASEAILDATEDLPTPQLLVSRFQSVGASEWFAQQKR
jgi:homoserine kinase